MNEFFDCKNNKQVISEVSQLKFLQDLRNLLLMISSFVNNFILLRNSSEFELID